MVSKQKTLKIFTERFLCLLLALLVSLPLFTTLTASATSGTLVDADYTDGTYSRSSDSKWYATYCPTAGYKGQGVLLYLLERDGGGAVAGTTPKAYACGSKMEGYELHAQINTIVIQKLPTGRAQTHTGLVRFQIMEDFLKILPPTTPLQSSHG